MSQEQRQHQQKQQLQEQTHADTHFTHHLTSHLRPTHPTATARIYSDEHSKDHKQGWISWIVAILTMTLYTGGWCVGCEPWQQSGESAVSVQSAAQRPKTNTNRPTDQPTDRPRPTTQPGWMHILILMTIGCFFSRTCLMVYLLIMSTLLLPPKPVLWTAFCQNPVFRTWREYFKFS
jgi:hypothetical protein